LRGGFPDSLLAQSDAHSLRWRRDFIRTYLERDIPQFGRRIAAETLRRFWTMLAHRQGAPLNMAELARNVGVDAKTAAHHVDLLLEVPRGRLWAVEVKRSMAPAATRGFHEACADLKPVRRFVAYRGDERYPLRDGVEPCRSRRSRGSWRRSVDVYERDSVARVVVVRFGDARSRGGPGACDEPAAQVTPPCAPASQGSAGNATMPQEQR
jgi:hypothetical protein